MMTTRDAIRALWEEATALRPEGEVQLHRMIDPVPDYPELHPAVAMEVPQASLTAQEGLVVWELVEIQGCQEMV